MSFNMGTLYKGLDGSYKDANGNIVGYWNRKQSGLTGDAWKYLYNKYGRDWANRVGRNMKLGYIYLNGKWDYDPKSSKRNSGAPEQNEESKYFKFTDKDGRFNTASLFKGTVNGISKFFGSNFRLSNSAGDLASTGVYFIPGVGNVASAIDAVDSFRNGDYASGAMSALWALPIIGNIGAGLRVGSKLAKVAKLGKTSERMFNIGTKASKSVENVSPVINKVLGVYTLPSMVGQGYLMYNLYNKISDYRDKMKEKADYIKRYFGEDSDEYRFVSLQNNFSNNMSMLFLDDPNENYYS